MKARALRTWLAFSSDSGWSGEDDGCAWPQASRRRQRDGLNFSPRAPIGYAMDRHSHWLRRRIIASVLSQTALTFVLVALIAAAVLLWRTEAGVAAVIPAALVIGQIVAIGRVLHAARANPLSYRYMQRFLAEPFRYQVTQLRDEPHEVAYQLPQFQGAATIADPTREPSPVFDIMHAADRTIAATIGRTSGSVSFSSSLADGRILVTDSRVVPPHELIVVNKARSSEVSDVLEAHLRAVRARTDVVILAPSAHQVSIDLLMLEHETYRRVGPLLAPFLDLEPGRRSPIRLTATLRTDELHALSEVPTPSSPSPLSGMQLFQHEIARALP